MTFFRKEVSDVPAIPSTFLLTLFLPLPSLHVYIYVWCACMYVHTYGVCMSVCVEA